MVDALVPLPSVDDYVSALYAIEDKVTDRQRRMLEVHHAAPARVMSASTLAEAVGYSGYTGANMEYGKVATGIGEALGLRLDGAKVGLLVDFVEPSQAANEHWLWSMRERFAVALEEAGWVPRVSQYLYPHLAMQQN